MINKKGVFVCGVLLAFFILLSCNFESKWIMFVAGIITWECAKYIYRDYQLYKKRFGEYKHGKSNETIRRVNIRRTSV